jgi:hypothetical protein
VSAGGASVPVVPVIVLLRTAWRRRVSPVFYGRFSPPLPPRAVRAAQSSMPAGCARRRSDPSFVNRFRPAAPEKIASLRSCLQIAEKTEDDLLGV